MRNAPPLGAHRCTRTGTASSSADRLLHAGAFNWTYALGVGLMDPWANGATSLVYDGPRDPEIWPGLIESCKATLFAAVPSLYRRLLKYGNVRHRILSIPAPRPDRRRSTAGGPSPGMARPHGDARFLKRSA